MAIRMRRGLESDFDPEKMVPGEWAVSTDTRYVRMCFATGIVLRMATYEAFEADMQEIQNILATCKDIQKAVEKFEGLAEQHADTAQSYSIESKSWSDSAKSYSEEATRQANLAKTYAEKASEVTEIDYATQDRAGIIKGGENHIAEDGTLEMTKRTTDKTLYNSYAGGIKVNEVVGKSEQGSTTGKNLLDCSGLTEQTINGVTFTPVYANGMLQYVNVNGTATAQTTYTINKTGKNRLPLYEFGIQKGDYVANGVDGGSQSTYCWFMNGTEGNYFNVTNGDIRVNVTDDSIPVYPCIRVFNGVTVNNIKFYPMIRLATIEDSTYEPYTGGIPSPNPDYPQEIKSVEVGEIKSSDDNGNESTVIFSTPITLRGIGDVTDRIVRKDGVWGVERNVAEIESYNGEIITTEYISTTGGLDTGATVDYVLSATTFEPLPEADQKALHTLQSFDIITYISTDSEVEPVIDLEYGTSRVGALALHNENDKEILKRNVTYKFGVENGIPYIEEL